MARMTLRRGTILYGATVIVLALGLPIIWVAYLSIGRARMDLSLLDPYVETQSYAKLIEAVQSRPVGKDGFSFVALGDSRSYFHRAKAILGKAAEEGPTFIFANGDIVRKGTVEEYLEHHFPLVETIAPIPYITAPGNHEEGPLRDFTPFKYLYGDLRFSFDYGGARFVGINNSDATKMGADDLAYLDRELAKPGAQYKFVTFHVPPAFLEQAVESEGERGFVWNAGKFHNLMVKHGVNDVFVGHVHGFATQVIDGVRYTITGGAGAELTEQLGEEGKFHHFVLVRVRPEGIERELVKLVHGEWVRGPIL